LEYFTTISVGNNCPGYYFNVATILTRGNQLGLSQNLLAVAPEKIDARNNQTVRKGNISLGGGTDAFPLTVTLPARTFPGQDYLVVIKNGLELLSCATDYQKFLNAYQNPDRRIKYLSNIQNVSAAVPFYRIEVLDVDGRSYFSGERLLARNLSVSFPYGYLDANSDGIIDATVGPDEVAADKLQVAVFNEAGNFWRLMTDNPLTIDRSNRTVNFDINHLSTFGLFGPPAPADDLSNVIIYPNPFKPTDGILENGEYGTGSDFGFIHLINLTADAQIYIYNIAGEIVRHNNLVVDRTGEVRWDGRNDDGRYCASGLYVVLIKDEKITSGKNKFLGKLAIVR
jgi:hypothetical protein